MEELSKHGRIGDAATKADMHRETARKYIAAGKLPSEMPAVRDWRTRPDPFEEHWPAIEARLRDTPECCATSESATSSPPVVRLAFAPRSRAC